MRTSLIFLAVLLVLQEPFNEALTAAGLSEETALIESQIRRNVKNDEFLLSTFEEWYGNPWRMPAQCYALRSSIQFNADRPADLVTVAGRQLGEGSVRQLIGNPIADAEKKSKQKDGLQAALRDIFQASGKQLPADVQRLAREADGKLPVAVREAAALVLFESIEARRWRDMAVKNISNLESAFRLEIGQRTDEDKKTDEFVEELKLMRAIDLKLLFAGAGDFVLAMQRATEALEKAKPVGDFNYLFATPWGDVVINGGENDRYQRKAYLLILDIGGDDTYFGGASTTDIETPVSGLIDLSGNDQYIGAPELAKTPIEKYGERQKAVGVAMFGGGTFGYGALIDCAGNDLYRTASPAFGSGEFGVGLLWDKSGADRYDSVHYSEGAGQFGIGILIDGTGNDIHHTFFGGQGFGRTKGFGLLLDCSGDDEYVANDTVIDYPSAQSKEHNTSLAQGCGFGVRRDFIDGHSLAGGIGVLTDMGGNDRYSCAVFGQGVGYWDGIGALFDTKGKDRYDGRWYVQGAAAHFAIGVLQDLEGDDRYTSDMNMSVGAGHDYSIGLFEDFAGNDFYKAATLSFGAANANGIGIFVDAAGDDQYDTPGVTLGWATDPGTGSLREKAFSLGLFIDDGGNDIYPANVSYAKNAGKWVNWTRKNEEPRYSQLGIFFDR